MAEQKIRELEEAAQVILAPTNLISSEQRQSAEDVFLRFRNTKSPYQLCRQILETSSTDYILFESAGLIKTALVKEWSTIPRADITSLMEYMFNYVISKPYLAPYVRGRIVEVLAIMIKKGSVADMGEERGRILSEVERLIVSGDLPRQLLGCSIISATVQEYAVSRKSSDIGLTWEVHRKEQELFQERDLKRIFKFSVGILGELIKKDMGEDTVSLLKHLLPIVEGVLSWPFRNREGTTSVSSSGAWRTFRYLIQDRTLPLMLVAEWEEIFLDPTILDFFFTLYWKVRGNPQLAHHARNCLHQLATLNGGTLSNTNVQLEYLTNYVQRFLELIANIDIIDQEASGIASIIKEIFVFRKTLISLPKDMLKSFWDHLSRLTCMFIENAAQEESLCVNDCLYTDALEYLFNVWIFILTEPKLFSPEFFNQSYIQIFNKYLQCHLSVPDGFRDAELKDLNEEQIDDEQDDKIRFKEQLQTIGSFGRQILSHSLPLLARLIEDRTSKLRENLNKVVGQTESINNSGNNSITGLYEDLHWLLLVAGHVLCMEAEGEVALIPSQIMRYSMKQVEQGQVDVNLTLQFLASSENIQSDMNISTDSIDCVVRLVADIFRLCAIEKTAISMHIESMLSPELSCTIMWFLHRWSLNYLILMESAYDEISTTLIQAFGEDSPGATWTMNFLLEKVEYNINAFKGEPALIKETIHLLIALVESRKKAACVLESERFRHIMDMATKGEYNFPQVVKRGLMQAIVLVGVAAPHSPNPEQCHWSQTLQALQTRCKRITSHEHFRASYHQEQIKVQIIDILECFIGAAQGVRPATADRVLEHTCPVLLELPNLLSLYCNYQEIVQLILELLCECTKGILGYLSQDDTVRLYEICLNIVQNYTGCNTNRLTVDTTTEEDSFQDILLLMQILTNLLRKEDSCTKQPGTNPSQVQSADPTAGNVSLRGLHVIMPLISMDLLKFPSLCLQYYDMLLHICVLYPANILNLSPEFRPKFLLSIELGLFSYGERVADKCYQILCTLAKHIYFSDTQKKKDEFLIRFLHLLLSVTLFHQDQTDPDFASNASGPLYSLICCYKEQYQQLAGNILYGQPNQEVAQRLAEAFAKLTANLSLELNFVERIIFRKNFHRFFITVREFLIVK